MQIKRLKIHNFKSLVHFEIEFAKLTCLIGMNGAGKTTLLQAMDFLAQLMRGRMDDWLRDRDWTIADLKNHSLKESNISFSLFLESSAGEEVEWSGQFNRSDLKLSHEAIRFGNYEDRFVISPSKMSLTTHEGVLRETFFHIEYQGSVFSVLQADTLHPVCIEFKHFMQNLSSLEALSPQLLRKRSREKTDSLGMGGEKLSAYIHGLPLKKRNQLSEWLRECYPHLEGVMTSSQKAGWKKLAIKEDYEKSFVTEDRHINDGMLRMLAILAETLTDHEFLLFDEIENGLHPEIIEFLLKKLREAKQQVVVTTHSPVILNYLDDEAAKEGVVLLYKTPEGYTQVTRLFDVPAMAKKLEVMGPGEAFADTDFTKLTAKLTKSKK